MNHTLGSPVGQYHPEILILAPKENPDDANLLSLASQVLEMGIAAIFGGPAFVRIDFVPLRIAGIRLDVLGDDGRIEKQIP